MFKLWSGGVPTISRAMALNLGMFTTYETAKEKLVKIMPENPQKAQVMASFTAGCVAAALSLPFDNAKTKLQKMKPNPDGTLPYKNIADAMTKEVQNNGVKGLWVGLPTYCFRVGPHVALSLLISE